MLDGFLKKLLGKPSDSKDVAKQRLKFALIYDKLEVSDNILENLHRDMVEVISRYFEIDRNAFKLDIHRSDELSALVVNTPILGAKHRDASQKSEAPEEPPEEPKTPREPKEKEKTKAKAKVQSG